MNIFVFEHVAGGGLASQRLPEGLCHEGEAMLAAAAADFQSAGHKVSISIDRRVSLPIKNVNIVTVESFQQCMEAFDQLAAEADATLVIAPETAGALLGYISRLEAAGRRHLGCSPGAIEICADKLALSGVLQKAGVPTPATDRRAEAFGFPLVVKPRVGAGCEDTFLVRNQVELEALPDATDRIYQPYKSGRAVSASFLVSGQNIQPLLAGDQVLSLSQKISYAGGRVPIEAALSDRANRLAIKAILAVQETLNKGGGPGVRGFVGVDLVLADEPEQDHVIEINPRLTVSYVAIRQLCHPPLAQAMLDLDSGVRHSGGYGSGGHDSGGHLLFDEDRVVTFDLAGTITENPR